MKLTSDELKELYQQRTTHSTRRPVECLTAETLRRAANRELSQPERERVADHLMVCADCAEEYRLIRSLRPWAERIAAASGDRAETEAKGRRWMASVSRWWKRVAQRPRWRAAAGIAVLVVAAGATLTLWRARQPGRALIPGQRGGGSVVMEVEPPNRAVLPEPPRQLTWSTVEGAERYQVVLYDVESTPIWESPWVASPSVTLPKTVGQKLQREQPYYWRITVMIGIERRQSQVFQFVVSAHPRD
ncbi:MAG: hypothetical protein D6791_04080 [Chloroflexi bacterium]|nr:MAG: hypothetical protein D6791_04080 [Chloroflexota bacterium]